MSNFFLRRHGIQCTNWKTTGRGTPWDLKPPSNSPRPLPSWIAQLLQDEAVVVGVDGGRRPLPFASALKASGVETWERDFGKKEQCHRCFFCFCFFGVMEFSIRYLFFCLFVCFVWGGLEEK